MRQKFSLSGIPRTADVPPSRCAMRPVCKRHARLECDDCVNDPKVVRDNHDLTNNVFIVLTTALGFHPFYRKSKR